MLADAVLVHDVGEQPPVVEALLASHRVPTVWVNTGRRGDSVDFADAAGATTAVQHLLAQGYQRPALLMACDPASQGQHISAQLRPAGWIAGCAKAGIAPRIVWPQSGRDVDGLRPFLASLLHAPDRPDALACYSHHQLFAARIIAGDLGFQVGRDLGLMSFSKPEDAIFDHAYTVCALDYRLLGREAVEMAWRRLDSGRSQAQVLVPEVIVRGGSTTTRHV
jgi:DNA-binding LacI/PurR family transcriptional regulator